MRERTDLPAHQFEDVDQQHEASRLGMWIFLATEILFFGGMFTGYALYRSLYPAAFADASRTLEIVLGATNTMVLIGSSLTMAMAVHAAQVGRRKALTGFLLATIGLGLAFLAIKGIEYAHKFEHHLVPGSAFIYTDRFGPQAQLFFSFYFVMTGMHALHMVIGVCLLAALVAKSLRNRFSSAYYTPVELIGLYWHFVDIIWIFLFPLLYLIDRH
ncbi:MAG: cytochrome oxidase subunit III [Candidatus Methylomirabilota bacterium]|nr:cytochrome c oxidase subunit 3 family protein [candidate division NC10 bacterium]PWB46320.1 MAG: cytochrome oxidase subunit III [candidate division NC10 bacterium]